MPFHHCGKLLVIGFEPIFNAVEHRCYHYTTPTYWCRRGESNPQNLDFKSNMYASSITSTNQAIPLVRGGATRLAIPCCYHKSFHLWKLSKCHIKSRQYPRYIVQPMRALEFIPPFKKDILFTHSISG